MRTTVLALATSAVLTMAAWPAYAGLVCTESTSEDMVTLCDDGPEVVVEDFKVGTTYDFDFTVPSGSEYLNMDLNNSHDYFSVDNPVGPNTYMISYSGGHIMLGAGTYTGVDAISVTLECSLGASVLCDPQGGFMLSDTPIPLDLLNVDLPLPGFSATPLPSTWLMLLCGLVGFGFIVYRGKKGSAALSAA